MEMQLDENSLLVTMNPLLLLGCFLVVFFIAFISVWVYRNTNDLDRSLKLYGILILFAIIAYMIIHIPFILCIAYAASGFFIMILISNHYFYKK